MPRLTRVERQQRTRDDLLQAAAVVFARRGFAAASLDEVADDAGYTKGAVYSNFNSKEELFLAVLENRLRDQVQFFHDLARQATADRGQDLPGLLPRLDDADEVWCLLEFEFWLYALRNPSLRARVAELYRDYRKRLAPVAAPYQTGTLSAEEVVATAIALYHGLTLQWHADPGAIRPDLVADVLRAMRGGVGA
ncbi:MAG TPA: TetR family transcriptional regulator [Chloroflexota bacterium]|jgi:AcrR family transcriptional regulator|nr:TetR family transcriptional regulator [Chloroflexota bacterium]